MQVQVLSSRFIYKETKLSEEDYIYKANKNRLLSEDDPTRMSTGKRRQFGYNCKRRSRESALYAKINRWLNSKVGSNWNNVWADICKGHDNTDKDELRKATRDAIDYYVEQNVMIKDGEMKRSNGKNIYSPFYVHPSTKILCAAPNRPKYRLPKPVRPIEYDGQKFFKEDDIWYQVILKDIEQIDRVKYPKYYNTWWDVYDVFKKAFMTERECIRFYGSSVYCVAKKQIGKRLIKKIENHLSAKGN